MPCTDQVCHWIKARAHDLYDFLLHESNSLSGMKKSLLKPEPPWRSACWGKRGKWGWEEYVLLFPGTLLFVGLDDFTATKKN